MTDVTVEPHPRRRLLLLIAVPLVVVLVVIGTLTWWLLVGRLDSARAQWQPQPAPTLSSMRTAPVPGWRISAVDLGVPDGGRIAADNSPLGSNALIGRLDNHMFLLATDPVGPQWWITGIDVSTGKRLFPAVRLTEPGLPTCYLNAPSHLLCLQRTAGTDFVATVVDNESGAVTYAGPTALRPGLAVLAVKQVGDYAVAETSTEGTYGIGPRGETTWFVPGHDDAVFPEDNRLDDAPPTLVPQLVHEDGKSHYMLFSVRDGHVLEPDLPDGGVLDLLETYAGGFAADIKVGDRRAGIAFFDDSGRRLAGPDDNGVLAGWRPGLPVLADGDTYSIYSPSGQRLFDHSEDEAPAVVLGSTLFVNESNALRQYDLKTGDKGPLCDFSLNNNFLGTDGEVVVLEVRTNKAPMIARAYDLKTCAELWTIPAQQNSLARIWRVDRTLVRLSDDGTEVASLVSGN